MRYFEDFQPEAAAKAEPKKEGMPRLDWAGLLRSSPVVDPSSGPAL
jgi:hypothetical protein